MEETRISTWKQVNVFFDMEGVTEDSLDKLCKRLDVDNITLADLNLKIYGPNYHSSIRSDFIEGIASFQNIFNRQLLFLLGDKNPYRVLNRSEKENFLFFISVNAGCTNILLELSKPILNSLTKRLNKMKSWQVCIILFSVIAIYNSPKYYESWNKHDTEKLEIQRKADNDKYEALLKIANSPVFQKYVTEQDYIDLKCAVLDDFCKQQIRATNELIRNTADVDRIEINDSSFNFTEIKQIKDTPDEDVIPTSSKFVEGLFQITSIDRLHYPSLRLHLKSEDKSNSTVDATFNCEDGSLTEEQIKLIWSSCEQGRSLKFKINETIAKDGKIKNAYIEYVTKP